ncbi:hypothetical protein EAI_08541, partial [Harpegnathos saltator]
QRKAQAQRDKEEAPTPQREMWTKVVGRREKKKEKEEQKKQEAKKVVKAERKEGRGPRRRIPNTAAVTITADKSQYKELLAEAKKRVDLTSIGIDKLKTRVGITGALVLEIPGEERVKRADILAEKLRDILSDRAKISRPQKMGELRLRNLEISTTEEEAAEEMAKAGGCEKTEVKTGKIRVTPNGIGSLWIQCPVLAAKRIAKMGNIRIGWTQVKVEMLRARPLQCYKCLEQGHVQQNCKNNIDRRTNCYRCGEQGH